MEEGEFLATSNFSEECLGEANDPKGKREDVAFPQDDQEEVFSRKSVSKKVKNTFSFDNAIDAARVECADAKGQSGIFKSLLPTEVKSDDYSVDTLFKKTGPSVGLESIKKKPKKYRGVKVLCGPKSDKVKRPNKRILSKADFGPNCHVDGLKGPDPFLKNVQRLSQLS